MRETAVILVVEDRQDDVLIILRTFTNAGITNPVQVVRSGEEALAYLGGEGKYSNRAEYPLPALVILDLNMPGIDGFEVLTWIRSQDGVRGLPVVVLTTSTRLSDVNRAYQLGANSFFVKEIDFHQSAEFGTLLRDYWLRRSRLPQTSRKERERTENQSSATE